MLKEFLSLFLLASTVQVPASGLFEPDAEGLQLIATPYDAEQSERYLQHDLLAKGYQPIQVTVHNSTSETYLLSRNGLSVNSLSPGKMARAMSSSALPRAVAWKILSFVFWPLAIPSAVDSVYTYKKHTKFKKRISSKAVKMADEAIHPYSTVERVFFMRSAEYDKTFSVTLYHAQTGQPVTYTYTAPTVTG